MIVNCWGCTSATECLRTPGHVYMDAIQLIESLWSEMKVSMEIYSIDKDEFEEECFLNYATAVRCDRL